MSHRVSVSSADFIRNIGFWQSEALRHPVSIKHHGRERLILASPDQFQRGSTDNEGALEQELVRSRNLKTTILDQVEEGYLRFDEQLHIASVNHVVGDLLGRPRDALIGATLADTLPNMASTVWQSHLQRVLRTRQSENFESKIDQLHIRVRAFPLPDGIGVVVHNITEEIRLREAHEVSEARAAAMQAVEELSSVQVSRQGRIEFADAAFCDLTGFDATELIGHRLSDLLRADTRRDLNAALEDVLGDAKRSRLAVSFLRKGGAERPVTLALAPILTDLVVRGAYGLVLSLRG